MRRPDPVPCANCAVGEWDMCRNGQYTEWGIKEHHGYARERYRITPDFVVKVDPAARRPGRAAGAHHGGGQGVGPHRAHRAPGPVEPRDGAHHRGRPDRPAGRPARRAAGLEVHVLDQVTDGLKPDLVAALGATYHHGSVADTGIEPDVAIECTGVGQLIFDVMDAPANNGIVCLDRRVSSGRELSVDVGLLNRRLVLEQRRGLRVGQRQPAPLRGRRAGPGQGRSGLAGPAHHPECRPLTSWQDAYQRQPTDVKVVLDFDYAG